ncbi:MAG TPA: HAMP domain-containing sensor histidine kinase [Tepidisphaeraceae bacterium]|nr:HAMP domain-containing sensor histidine kinase [Tepidisphaeraceae bacterium]
MAEKRLPAAVRHFVIPIVSVALAVPVMRLLMDYGDVAVTPPCFAAVIISAWYGGLEGGLLATVLAGVSSAWILMPDMAIRDHILRVAVFAVVAVLASSLQAATKRAAQSAKEASDAAEEASKATSRFLAMLSHELRTPLNPIVTIARAYELDANLSPQLREDMSMIRQNVELETRLIDDLLDLTRIENKKMDLHLARISVDEPLKRAIDICEPEAKAKGVGMRLQLAAGESTVNGDAIRLQQVFWNLIRNAVKFTPSGGRVEIHTENARHGVLVRISDTGIGIEPSRLTRIFEAFEQGAKDIPTRFGGLGLGLAICDALTRAHAGTVTAASEGRGRGAVFTVWLPLADEAAGVADKSGRRRPCGPRPPTPPDVLSVSGGFF